MSKLQSPMVDLPALVQLLKRRLAEGQSLTIAIDGRCGGGKTTLAAELQAIFSAALIHADDFFLRPEQRTPERLAEPGGNMDRERLAGEVLIPLREGRPFSYRPFDCATLSLTSPISVAPAPLTIVEGSYSCHPALWDYYDLHIFVDVDSEEQLRRITKRNGADMARVFAERWIPMEERYFETFSIQERCELTIRP